MKNLLLFLPNMIILCAKLMVDKRVPRTERRVVRRRADLRHHPVRLHSGHDSVRRQIDDLFLISMTVLRLIDRTDDLVVREHWHGRRRHRCAG